MNERIKKLAEQAELNLELQSLKVEKFAELMVKECINSIPLDVDPDEFSKVRRAIEHVLESK